MGDCWLNPLYPTYKSLIPSYGGWVVQFHKKLRHTECAYYFARQDAAPTMGMVVRGESFAEYRGNVRGEIAQGYGVPRAVVRLRRWFRHTHGAYYFARQDAAPTMGMDVSNIYAQFYLKI